MANNTYLVDPLLFYRYDYCFKCSSTSIEAFDYFNSKLGYSKLVSDKIANRSWYINKAIFYFKCNNCGEKYKVQFYGNDKFPIPLRSSKFFISTFMNGYKEDGENIWNKRNIKRY